MVVAFAEGAFHLPPGKYVVVSAELWKSIMGEIMGDPEMWRRIGQIEYTNMSVSHTSSDKEPEKR